MITLEEAKIHLRVDDDASDIEIQTMIDAAQVHVENYLGLTYENDPAPAPVKSAALLLVGDLFANREVQSEVALFTNRTFAQLLNPYRLMSL